MHGTGLGLRDFMCMCILFTASWKTESSLVRRCYSCISIADLHPDNECRLGPLSSKYIVTTVDKKSLVARGGYSDPWSYLVSCIANPPQCHDPWDPPTNPTKETTRSTTTLSTTKAPLPTDGTTTDSKTLGEGTEGLKIYCTHFQGTGGDKTIAMRSLFDTVEDLDGVCRTEKIQLSDTNVEGHFCYCEQDLCNKILPVYSSTSLLKPETTSVGSLSLLSLVLHLQNKITVRNSSPVFILLITANAITRILVAT